MCRTLANSIALFGILAAAGCGGPGPTEKGGGFQLPPEAQKAQDDAAATPPEQMMEKMKKTGKAGDPTKK